MSDIAVTNNGCLVRISSDLVTGWVRCSSLKELQAYADAELPDGVKEGVEWNQDTKIPAELFKKVLGTVHHYPRMETGYVIYRNGMTRAWDIRAPEQKGSGAHVNFFEEAHPDSAFQVVGTIHTHPEMGAFWSGTDLNDQTRKPGTVHMVFGLREGHVAESLCTLFLDRDVRYDIPLQSIVDDVDLSADYDPVPEWKEIIDRQSFKLPEAAKNQWTDWSLKPAEFIPRDTGKLNRLKLNFDDSIGGWEDDEEMPAYQDMDEDTADQLLDGLFNLTQAAVTLLGEERVAKALAQVLPELRESRDYSNRELCKAVVTDAKTVANMVITHMTIEKPSVQLAFLESALEALATTGNRDKLIKMLKRCGHD